MALKFKFLLFGILAILLLGVSTVSATENLNVNVNLYACKVDGICEGQETAASCPLDCACGNGTIDAGETCDLGAGNGACPSTCSNSCQTQCCNNCGGGGGGGGHTLAINNIAVTGVTDKLATVNWLTSDAAVCEVVWGLNTNYDVGSSLEISAVINHSINLPSLIANTTYHYKISCTDSYPSSAVSGDYNFLTLSTVVDLLPPQNVTDLVATAGNKHVVLSWLNPSDIDFAGVVIRRSISSIPALTEGVEVYSGYGEALDGKVSFDDTGLVNNVIYYYTVFAYDTSTPRNYASGVGVQATPFLDATTPTSTPPYPTSTPPYSTSTPPYSTSTPPLATSTPPYSTSTPSYGTHDLNFGDFGFFQTGQQLAAGADDVINVVAGQEIVVRLAAAKVLPATSKMVLNLSVNSQIVSYPFQVTVEAGDYTLSIPGLVDLGKYWVTILVFDTNSQNSKTLYGWIQAKPVEIVKPPLAVVSIIEEISQPLQIILKPVQQILQPIQQVAATPAAQTGVAVTVAIAAANIIVAVPWWNWWYLLQFIFTQPLQLFFRRKGWGVVYNSITKKPVDLALVRLYDYKTKRLISSKVTDQQGRYMFLVDAGEYYLRVEKPDFEYPGKLLKDVRDDGSFLDLYYGAPIVVNPGEKVAIVANIPIDPADLKISDAEIIRRFSKQRNARYFSWLGPIIAVVYLIIVPSWLSLVVVVVHLLVLVYFRRTTQKLSGKKWGIVYDVATKKPLGKSITRIISPEYGRMLEFYVTDSQGRYGFLAGDNKYYVMADKVGYQTAKTPVIDLTHSKGGAALVAKDLGLIKATTTATESTNQAEPLKISASEASTTDQALTQEAENKKEKQD